MNLTPWRRRKTEQRVAEWGSSALPSYFEYLGYGTDGPPATPTQIQGLPAFAAGVLLVAETAATLPLMVYRDEQRDRATGSWQYKLLHDAPCDDDSVHNFYSDIFASIEYCGNALALKNKDVATRRVIDLDLLDMNFVRIYRDKESGEKLFQVQDPNGGGQQTASTDDIIHFRGPTFKGGLVGLSPIAIHRATLGNAVSIDQFAGRYFANNMQPGMGIVFPLGVTKDQADQWQDNFNAKFGNPEGWHKPLVIGGGADIKPIPISLADAQFVEGKQWAVHEIAMLLRIFPAEFLTNVEGQRPTEEDRIRFMSLTLNPRLSRVEAALRADPDIFGRGSLFPEFLRDGIMIADHKTRGDFYKSMRQTGVMTANEIRERENLPPHPDGDQLLITPVGAGANPDNQEPVPSEGAADNQQGG